jgi:hypothetical protein
VPDQTPTLKCMQIWICTISRGEIEATCLSAKEVVKKGTFSFILTYQRKNYLCVLMETYKLLYFQIYKAQTTTIFESIRMFYVDTPYIVTVDFFYIQALNTWTNRKYLAYNTFCSCSTFLS